MGNTCCCLLLKALLISVLLLLWPGAGLCGFRFWALDGSGSGPLARQVILGASEGRL